MREAVSAWLAGVEREGLAVRLSRGTEAAAGAAGRLLDVEDRRRW